MTKFNGMRGLQFLAGGALLMFANLSQAQYVWVDEKGIKQFSDRAPPASVPQKNVLKAPRGSTLTAKDLLASDAAANAAGVPPPAAPQAKPNLADREADFKKRQADKALADKKAATEAAAAASKKANCEAAKLNKAQLDSGVRVRTGPNGDYMDDKARAEEAAKANQAIAACN